MYKFVNVCIIKIKFDGSIKFVLNVRYFIDRMNSYNDLYLFLLGSNLPIGNLTTVNPSNTVSGTSNFSK